MMYHTAEAQQIEAEYIALNVVEVRPRLTNLSSLVGLPALLCAWVKKNIGVV